MPITIILFIRKHATQVYRINQNLAIQPRSMEKIASHDPHSKSLRLEKASPLF